MVDSQGIYCEIALRWMPLTDEWTLLMISQHWFIVAWGHQAITSTNVDQDS